jgi:SARP family transcriptional regulator, regulator of embCAB operon
MPQDDDLRIHLLRDLRVDLPDGSTVPIRAWRTSKTRDLLRLLALNNGHPVRQTSLIDKLWPDASLDRARGSLRTAASQIRRSTQHDCVVRRPDGLVLRGAWVDAIEFQNLAHRVQVASRGQSHAEAVRLARRAENLYAGDFHADDDDCDWARTEREHLVSARQLMLSSAAESALTTGQLRDALELARTAVRLDPSSETAHRSLMRAHAELGEVGSALRVFESFRAHLAAELGADPSPQTQELHLGLLRGAGVGAVDLATAGHAGASSAPAHGGWAGYGGPAARPSPAWGEPLSPPRPRPGA